MKKLKAKPETRGVGVSDKKVKRDQWKKVDEGKMLTLEEVFGY